MGGSHNKSETLFTLPVKIELEASWKDLNMLFLQQQQLWRILTKLEPTRREILLPERGIFHVSDQTRDHMCLSLLS